MPFKITHDLLLPAEAAELLRRGPRTLARWRAEGVGPRYSKVGSRILYPRGEIEEWLARTIKQPVRNPEQDCLGAPQRERGAHQAPCSGLTGGLCSTPLQKYIEEA
jgi:predicted DNA-binding transcriptional regulator AlpA